MELRTDDFIQQFYTYYFVLLWYGWFIKFSGGRPFLAFSDYRLIDTRQPRFCAHAQFWLRNVHCPMQSAQSERARPGYRVSPGRFKGILLAFCPRRTGTELMKTSVFRRSNRTSRWKRISPPVCRGLKNLTVLPFTARETRKLPRIGTRFFFAVFLSSSILLLELRTLEESASSSEFHSPPAGETLLFNDWTF